jgi:hypothetical protein
MTPTGTAMKSKSTWKRVLGVGVLAPVIATGLLAAAPLSPMDVEEDWRASIPSDLTQRFSTQPVLAAAFTFVHDDPALPRALVIGDSISILYTPDVQRLLHGRVNVHRIFENGGETTRGLAKIDHWLGAGKWDVIYFNWGLHDLAQNAKGVYLVPLPQYEKNLHLLVARLKRTGAKLVFATTTPVPAGSKGRTQGDEVKYNDVACRVMVEEGVAVDDLAGAIRPYVADYQGPGNVHFGPAGSEFLAERVAASITRALEIAK